MRAQALILWAVLALCVIVQNSALSEPTSENSALKAQLSEEDIAMSKLRIKRAQMDEDELKAIREFKREERSAAVGEYKLRQRLYERQLYYHPIVLGVVILIVFAGVAFCAFQVWRDIKFGLSTTTTFKISRDGLEISSSVIGLISLGLSFLFFYFYVTAIYKLSDNDIGPAPVAERKATQQSDQKTAS